MLNRFHVYVCARTSDIETLKRDLSCSPGVMNGDVGLTVLWNQASASGAFARAMETATAEILVFTHCDVFFPTGWFERLAWEVDRLGRMDPDWAVASVFGITPAGDGVGRMWDCALEPIFRETSGVIGTALTTPVPIVSLDEMAFAVRREAGVSFDPSLPEFHLYGTDIVLEAERQGKRSYGLDVPLIHNAKPQLRIGSDYARSYRYMVTKWRDRLPVKTPSSTLSINPLLLPLRHLRVRYKALCRPSTYSTLRISDPNAKAVELGLDKLLLAPINEAAISNAK